jgi:hypothetical protein
MGRLFERYVRNARLIGALYCIIPAVGWFLAAILLNPFRSVYLFRLAISVAIGGYLGARANEYGLRLWLAKHRSPDGPATIADGAFIGAGVGLAATLLTPLMGLIASNHPEEAKFLVILSWLVALFNGCWVGALVARWGLASTGSPTPAPTPKPDKPS